MANNLLNTLKFSGLNSQNKNVQYFVDLKGNIYIFRVNWNDYCDCAFLSIYDYNDNPIIMGKSLTTNLIIQNYNLPYIFMFANLNEETYEPTIDTIADDFALIYQDEEI